jgi:hypothetical protein
MPDGGDRPGRGEDRAALAAPSSGLVAGPDPAVAAAARARVDNTVSEEDPVTLSQNLGSRETTARYPSRAALYDRAAPVLRIIKG